jgi:hypothetical protein
VVAKIDMIGFELSAGHCKQAQTCAGANLTATTVCRVIRVPQAARQPRLSFVTLTEGISKAMFITKVKTMFALLLAAGVVGAASSQSTPEPRSEQSGENARKALFRRVEALRPAPELLRWRQIPWMTDLVAAQRTAKDEKRLLLIWASGDEPVGRC